MIDWRQFLSSAERENKAYVDQKRAGRESTLAAENAPRCRKEKGTSLRTVPSKTRARPRH